MAAVTLPKPIQIGQIKSAHGVKGELYVEHFVADPKQLSKQNVMMLELVPGSYIPFFIEQIRAVEPESFIVKFEEISTPEEAKAHRLLNVYASPLVQNIKLARNQWDALVGFKLVDAVEGLSHNIIRIDTLAGQEFFIVDFNGNELMIPIQDSFIKDVLQQRQEVILQLPSGYIAAFT